MTAPVKAAVLSKFGERLEIREYPEPKTLEPGEALVRIELAGICGTDVHLFRGELKVPLPLIMGHETVGRIEKLGGEVLDYHGTLLSLEDRVCWASSISCGQCFYCLEKKQPTRCLTRRAYGISYDADEAPHLRGGYAEKILLRAGTSIFRIPSSLASEAVIGAGCALTTALHGMERCPVEAGDIVVIQGSGPVGLAALAVARQRGASRAVVVGGPSHRLEMAKRFGCDVCISVEENPTVSSRREQVLAATTPYGADMVIECVGAPEAVNEGLDYCRDGARFLVLGQYANAGNISFNPHTITRKQLLIQGSWGFEPRHVDQALTFLQSDIESTKNWKNLFASQITHRFPLAQAAEALETTKEWRSGKTVILPQS